VLEEIEKQSKLFGPPSIEPPFTKLPANIQKLRLWALAQPAHMLSDNNPFEGEEMAAMYDEHRNYEYPLGDLPLVVIHREVGGYKPIPNMISADQVQQLERERLSLNQELASLSKKQQAHHRQKQHARGPFGSAGARGRGDPGSLRCRAHS